MSRICLIRGLSSNLHIRYAHIFSRTGYHLRMYYFISYIYIYIYLYITLNLCYRQTNV